MATLLQALIGGRFRAFDSNGNPLAGGQLYAYAAGTTTPQDTFTTSAGTVANANPVVLNAGGEADVWLGTSGNYKFVLKDASGVIQWTVDNWPPSGGGGGSAIGAENVTPGGRLTLSSSLPVTAADMQHLTTVYYLPYKSDKVPLYDGTAWALASIGAGLSQATTDSTKSPAAVANNSNYDLFIWNDAGTIRLSRGPLWTSDTGRGTGIGTTELVQQNGRYLNKNSITNGPSALTGLYVGTIRSDGAAQVNDASVRRNVWNMDNRVRRYMLQQEATANWAYTASTWRQANANAANQLEMVRGLDEDMVSATVVHSAYSASDSPAAAAIGLDATNAPSTGGLRGVTDAFGLGILTASWKGMPGLGRHLLTWLEFGSSGVTFGGTTCNGQPVQSGIDGDTLA